MGTLKYTASVLELLGRPCSKPAGDSFGSLAAIHPESNLFFLAGGVETEKTLVSHDMDNKKLHVICTLEEYDGRTAVRCSVNFGATLCLLSWRAPVPS